MWVQVWTLWNILGIGYVVSRGSFLSSLGSLPAHSTDTLVGSQLQTRFYACWVCMGAKDQCRWPNGFIKLWKILDAHNRDYVSEKIIRCGWSHLFHVIATDGAAVIEIQVYTTLSISPRCKRKQNVVMRLIEVKNVWKEMTCMMYWSGHSKLVYCLYARTTPGLCGLFLCLSSLYYSYKILRTSRH